ncbi:hypothetical protein [Streptomyces sp. SHP 1-2]|uniref:hypothetical protein n=1 Tax=Streptomyces sp. SHP 1-2 TaxID=2769489 RepID=UPI002238A27B|nr:hypothetical protein [Streptomyces sp. SHP 1-2]MCW5249183.1 hypothetical protein [Streptomyces sp. SHP 1-2]
MVVLLKVARGDSVTGSRLGGDPPGVLAGHPVLDTHHYLFTLAAGTAPWQADREVSVLVRRGYAVGDPDDRHPDIALRAVLHSPSPRCARAPGAHPFLASRSLEAGAPGAPDPALIRIADEAHRVQWEESSVRPLLDDGLRFLFTFDEDGYPVDDDVVTEYQFGYGAVHFFGRLDADGRAVDVVAGFVENS